MFKITPSAVPIVDENTRVEHCARKGPYAYVFHGTKLGVRWHKRADGVWQEMQHTRGYSHVLTVDNHLKI